MTAKVTHCSFFRQTNLHSHCHHRRSKTMEHSGRCHIETRLRCTSSILLHTSVKPTKTGVVNKSPVQFQVIHVIILTRSLRTFA